MPSLVQGSPRRVAVDAVNLTSVSALSVNKTWEPQVEQQVEQQVLQEVVQELTKQPTVPQSSFCLTPDSRRERTLPTKTPSVSKPSCSRKQDKLQDNLIPPEHASVPHLSQNQNKDFQPEGTLPSRQNYVPHSSQYQHPAFQHGREFTSRQPPVPHSPHCQHTRFQHSSGSMTPDGHHHLHLPNNPITVPLPSYTKTQGLHHDKRKYTNQTSLQWSFYHQERQVEQKVEQAAEPQILQEEVQELTKQPTVPQSSFCPTPNSRRERTLPKNTPSVSKPSCNRKQNKLQDNLIPTEHASVPHLSQNTDFQPEGTLPSRQSPVPHSSVYHYSGFQPKREFPSRQLSVPHSPHSQQPHCQHSSGSMTPAAHRHKHVPNNPITVPLPSYSKTQGLHHDEQQHTNQTSLQWSSYHQELPANQYLDLHPTDKQTPNVNCRLPANQRSASHSSSAQLPNVSHCNPVPINQQAGQLYFYNNSPNTQVKNELMLYSCKQEPDLQQHGRRPMSPSSVRKLYDQFSVSKEYIQYLLNKVHPENSRYQIDKQDLHYSLLKYNRQDAPYNQLAEDQQQLHSSFVKQEQHAVQQNHISVVQQEVEQQVEQVLTKQPTVPQSAFCLTPDSRHERTLPTKPPSVSKSLYNPKPENLHDSRIPTERTSVPHSSHYESSDFQHVGTSHYQHPSCRQSPNHTQPDAHHRMKPDAHHCMKPDAHHCMKPDAHHCMKPDAHHRMKPDAHHRMKPDAHHRMKPDAHHHTHLPNGECCAYKELPANQTLDLSSSDNQTLNVDSRLTASQPSTSHSSSNQLPNDLHYNSVFVNQHGVNYYNMGPNIQLKVDQLSAQNFKVQESSAFQNNGELTVHQLSNLHSSNQEPSIQPHWQMSLSSLNSGELLDQTHNLFQNHTQGIQHLIPLQHAEYRRIKKFQSELPYSVIWYQRRGMPHNLHINSNETKAQSCNNVPATGSREGSDAEVGVPAADAIINKRRRISHNAQKAFQCPYCYKSYTTKYWLDRHVVRSHQPQPGSV